MEFSKMKDCNCSKNDRVLTVTITDQLSDKIVIILEDMIGSNAIFTAFDVTKRIRVENPTMDVPHEDVKEMVQDCFYNDFYEDYCRKCIDLTVSARAYVYYPTGKSPYDHPLAVQEVVPTTKIDTDLTIEKRLNISKHFLTKLGLVPGKLVRVETVDGVMSLTSTTNSSGSTLLVNTDGRVRLNSQMLTEAFGRLPLKYNISFNDDDFSIEVKAL